MGADPKLVAAVALQRASRALRLVESLPEQPVPAAPEVSFRIVDNDLVVTVDGAEQNLGRVVGRDGDSVKLEDVLSKVYAWLRENITQPKDGASATPEQIAQAVAAWLAEHKAEMRGKDADPVDVQALQADLRETTTRWLAANIRQPKDGDPGRAPTREEIELAVSLWMEFNIADWLPDLNDLRPMVIEWLTKNIAQPKNGAPATAEQIQRAVDAWLQRNFKQPEPLQPQLLKGLNGVGIDDITQPKEGIARITLTDGRHFDLKLPRGKAGESQTMYLGGGSGMSAQQVQQLIQEALASMGMYDDYKQIEYLDEQPGTGEMLTFTFSAPVQFIVIEMISTLTDLDAQEAQEGSAASGGTIPSATRGALLKHAVPITLLDDTDIVKVLPPASTRIRVYGKRRTAV